MGLSTLTRISIENVLGANEATTKIELALQAELIHKLASRNKINCPKQLVKSVAQVIGYSEKLDTVMLQNFKRVMRLM